MPKSPDIHVGTMIIPGGLGEVVVRVDPNTGVKAELLPERTVLVEGSSGEIYQSVPVNDQLIGQTNSVMHAPGNDTSGIRHI